MDDLIKFMFCIKTMSDASKDVIYLIVASLRGGGARTQKRGTSIAVQQSFHWWRRGLNQRERWQLKWVQQCSHTHTWTTRSWKLMSFTIYGVWGCIKILMQTFDPFCNKLWVIDEQPELTRRQCDVFWRSDLTYCQDRNAVRYAYPTWLTTGRSRYELHARTF